MKTYIVVATMLLAGAVGAQAQNISKNALGLRLGSNDGFGTEISYQTKLAVKNRVELDLGWRNHNNEDKIKIAGVYQWVWNLDGGLNWYAGLGGGAGTWRYDNNKGFTDNGAFAFLAGDLGIEYNFDFPLQVSLDLRPEYYLNSGSYSNNHYGSDVALGARYRF